MSEFVSPFSEQGTTLEIPEGTQLIRFIPPDEDFEEIHGERFRRSEYLALTIADSGELDVQSSDRSFGSGYEKGTFFISTNGVTVYFESDNSPKSTASTHDKIIIDPKSKIRVFFGHLSRTNQLVHVPTTTEYPEYADEGWHLLHPDRKSIKITPGFSVRTINTDNDAIIERVTYAGLILDHGPETTLKPTNKRPPRKLTSRNPNYTHDGYKYFLDNEDTLNVSLSPSRKRGWIFVTELEAPTEETPEVQEINGLRFIDNNGQITILDSPDLDENYFAGLGTHLIYNEKPTLHLAPARTINIRSLDPRKGIKLKIENSSQGDRFIFVSIDGTVEKFKMHTEKSVIDLGVEGLSAQITKTEEKGLQIHIENNSQDAHPFIASVEERADQMGDNEDVDDVDTI